MQKNLHTVKKIEDDPRSETKEKDQKMIYKINYTNGDPSEEATDLSAAYAGLQEEFPGCHIEDCGDRWLVWETEEDSLNDDGAKAVAEIRKIEA